MVSDFKIALLALLFQSRARGAAREGDQTGWVVLGYGNSPREDVERLDTCRFLWDTGPVSSPFEQQRIAQEAQEAARRSEEASRQARESSRISQESARYGQEQAERSGHYAHEQAEWRKEPPREGRYPVRSGVGAFISGVWFLIKLVMFLILLGFIVFVALKVLRAPVGTP